MPGRWRMHAVAVSKLAGDVCLRVIEVCPTLLGACYVAADVACRVVGWVACRVVGEAAEADRRRMRAMQMVHASCLSVRAHV